MKRSGQLIKSLVYGIAICFSLDSAVAQNYELKLGGIYEGVPSITKILHASSEEIIAKENRQVLNSMSGEALFRILRFENLKRTNQSEEFNYHEKLYKNPKNTEYLFGTNYIRRENYNKKKKISTLSLTPLDNRLQELPNRQIMIWEQPRSKTEMLWHRGFYSSESGKKTVQIAQLANWSVKEATYYVRMFDDEWNILWSHEIITDMEHPQANRIFNVVVSENGAVALQVEVSDPRTEGAKTFYCLLNENGVVFNKELEIPSKMYPSWFKMKFNGGKLVIVAAFSKKIKSIGGEVYSNNLISEILIQKFDALTGDEMFKVKPNNVDFKLDLNVTRLNKLDYCKLQFVDIQFDSEENILLFGEYKYDYSIGENSYIMGGDIYLLKLNDEGDVLWDQQIFNRESKNYFNHLVTTTGYTYLIHNLDKRYLNKSNSAKEIDEIESDGEPFSMENGCIALTTISPSGEVKTEVLVDHSKTGKSTSVTSIPAVRVADNQWVFLLQSSIDNGVGVKKQTTHAYRFAKLLID